MARIKFISKNKNLPVKMSIKENIYVERSNEYKKLYQKFLKISIIQGILLTIGIIYVCIK